MGRVFPLLTLLSLFCLSTNVWLTEATVPSRPLPFKFTYLFTVKINLDLTYRSAPIPVPGGVQLTEPISNGTVAGPAANGTIESGIASPLSLYNNTVQVPVIQVYGHMDDGAAFTINELGIGTPQLQVTRIQISIGGGKKYEALRNGYVLTTVTPSKDRSNVDVECYLVENIAKNNS